MRLRPPSIAAALIVLAALVAGCGGGSSSSPSSPSSPSTPEPGTETAAGEATMAQYVAQADALCEAENERLSSVGKKLGGVLSKAEATGELGHVAAPMRAFSDEIRTGLAQFEALEPPAAQRDAVAAMIATEAAQVDLFDELAAAFESGDRGTAHAVEARLVRNKKSYGEQTEELGFQVCGVSSR